MPRPPSDGLKAVVHHMKIDPAREWDLRELYQIYRDNGGLGSYTNFHTIIGRLTADARPEWVLGPDHPITVAKAGSRSPGGKKKVRWGLPPNVEPNTKFMGYSPSDAPPLPKRSEPASDQGGFQKIRVGASRPQQDQSGGFELGDDDMDLGPAGAGSPPPPKTKQSNADSMELGPGGSGSKGPPAAAKVVPAISKLASPPEAKKDATSNDSGSEDQIFSEPTFEDPSAFLAEDYLSDAIGEEKTQNFREKIEGAVENGHDEGLHTIVKKMIPREHWHLAWIVALGIANEEI